MKTIWFYIDKLLTCINYSYNYKMTFNGKRLKFRSGNSLNNRTARVKRLTLRDTKSIKFPNIKRNMIKTWLITRSRAGTNFNELV